MRVTKGFHETSDLMGMYDMGSWIITHASWPLVGKCLPQGP